MDEKTKELIRERFDALPKSIQEVILSSHYEETLVEICKQYNLNVEQMGILERETTLVMMGLTPTKDYEKELTHELNIEEIKGSQIVKDINEKIFLKIRELLKLMNTPKGEEPNLEETSETSDTSPNNTFHSEEEKNTQILGNAGIEIVSEAKKETPPIFAQKLSGYVKNDVVETQHSLENLTSSNPTPSPIPQKPTSTIDPYRERPE